jgi:hypothetical protein
VSARRERPEPEVNLWDRFPDRRGFWIVNTIVGLAASGALLTLDIDDPPGPLWVPSFVIAAGAYVWFLVRVGRGWWRIILRPKRVEPQFWMLAYKPPYGRELKILGWAAWAACLFAHVAFLVSFISTNVRLWW